MVQLWLGAIATEPMLILNNGVHDFHLMLFPGDKESKTINKNYKLEKYMILSTSAFTHPFTPIIVFNQNMQNQTKSRQTSPVMHTKSGY